MKTAIKALKSPILIIIALLTGLTTQAQAFTVTSGGATREGDLIRYNFIIDNWSTSDQTQGVCRSTPQEDRCSIMTSTWRYSTGDGTAAFPTQGKQSWKVNTRPNSTYGNMLQDLQERGFYIPLRTSVLIPASVDVRDACVGLTFATSGPNLGGGYTPFGPCLRLVNAKPPELSCETPDVHVEMGEYFTGDFSNYGDATIPKSFNIKLNKCSSGLTKVKYTLSANPTVPAVNPTLGIIELNKSSTAKGIALQVLDSSLTPIQLSKEYTFNAYGGAGGNFYIPMYARYIRTLPNGGISSNGEGVTGGTANTELTFIMSYL